MKEPSRKCIIIALTIGITVLASAFLYARGGKEPAYPRVENGQATSTTVVGDSAPPGAALAHTYLRPGTYTGTVMVGNAERSYIVHVPVDYDGTAPLPLVVNLHGALTTAADQRRISGFDATADAHKFVVVYPQGINKRWNDGRAGTVGATEGADDIGFLKALVSELSRKTPIDARRIYITGISNGGHMTNFAACRLADIFAAAAPVAAPLSTEVKGECRPNKPVAVLAIHGTADTYDPYNGGESGYGPVTSALDTFDFWSQTFSCAGKTVEPMPDKDTGDGTTVRYMHTTDCANPGIAIGLYTIEGGGHTWPDTASATRWSERLLGKTTHDIGNEEIWVFFAAHAR